MNQHDTKRENRLGAIFRMMMLCTAALLVPPLLAATVAPMLLLLIPVAIVASVFLIAALLSGSLAAQQDVRRRASWRPPPAPMLHASPVDIGARNRAGLPSAPGRAQRLADGALRVSLAAGERRGPTSVVLASPALIARAFTPDGAIDSASDGGDGEDAEPDAPHVVASENVA